MIDEDKIRIKLSEKHTVPLRLGDIHLVRLIIQPLRVENLYLTRCR